MLLEGHASVNQADTEDGTTALMLAAQKGRAEVVRILLAAGADVNQAKTSDGMTALMLASLQVQLIH